MDRLKPSEHKFKAMVFRMWRPVLKRGQKDFEPLDSKALRKVLFLRPEKIGDMVVSLPVFDGLRSHFPHIRISILGSPKNKALITDDPRFETVFLYTKNVWRDIKTIRRMRRGDFDCVVDMIADDSVTSLFLSQLCAPGKPRIGLGKVKFREYYDYTYDVRQGNTGHIVDNTLKLLTAFGIETDTLDTFSAPYVKPEDLKKAETFISSISNIDPSAAGPLYGYNLSAGAPNRVWAEERSRELIERILAGRDDCNVILFTTPAERERGTRIKSHFEGRVHLVPDGLNLIQAAALISKMDLVISPDTSIVHIARAFRVPVVGLYSRFMKNFLLWRPYAQEDGAVVSGNDHNIFDITVDQVFATFLKVSQNIEEKSHR